MHNQQWTPKKISLLLVGILIGLGCCIAVLNYPLGPSEEYLTPYCKPLPATFSDADLVGTWVAKYSGGDSIDKLQIRSDGTYKQIFSSKSKNFESDWQEWSIEYHPNGYALLHLKGMKRCDGTIDECNHPGGGLREGGVAVNICEGGPIYYTNEVILFVTGSSLDIPRGIKLIHARPAGSEWNYSFQLDESVKP